MYISLVKIILTLYPIWTKYMITIILLTHLFTCGLTMLYPWKLLYLSARVHEVLNYFACTLIVLINLWTQSPSTGIIKFKPQEAIR